MDPASTESTPGCLVVLISLSAGMSEDARVRLSHRYSPEDEPEIRELPKEFAARYLVDEFLEGLVNTLAQGYAIPLEIAVIGYNSGEDGALTLASMLPGSGPAARFVTLADLSGMTVESRRQAGDPRKWIAPRPCAGGAPAAAALAEVYRQVSVWLTGRFTARPPVVIHCTDGTGLDENYARIARSLGSLQTMYGPARLLHNGFIAGVEPVLAGEWKANASDPWAGLLELSALLPAGEGRPGRRAVSVNDFFINDPWSALFDLAAVGDATDWTDAQTGRFTPALREFWTQKLGNKPEEWEDAFAANPDAGTVVVADGASSGIYCRIWADQLARRFVTDKPDARDPVAFGKWVHGLRGEWRTSINYASLNWAKQRKVDDVGAAATFLALEVGPADGDGNRLWRACAVGDASLFWVRDGKLRASFPVVAHDQFGSAPLLIRSNPGFKTMVLSAGGVCRPGDRFVLATDAVASRLLKCAATGDGPDWDRFETLEDEAWRREMDRLRQSHEMVNDDCTLLAFQIAPAKTPKAADPVVVMEPPEAYADSPLREADIPTGEHQPLPAVAVHHEEPAPEPPATPADSAAPDHPGTQENGTVPPNPESEQPMARDGFPNSTDESAV